MSIKEDVLKKEVEDQIERWRYLQDSFSARVCGKTTEYILNNKDLMSLYSRADTDKMIEEYKQKISAIQDTVINPKNTYKRNILNTLEYIRMMHSFENIKESQVMSMVYSLSQSSVSQTFLGKGVCASQARLMRDVLPSEDTKVLTVEFRDKEEPGMILECHDVLITKMDEKLIYADPTWYNGSRESLVGSKDAAHYGNYNFESIDATEEEIQESRQEIQQKLIGMLKIDEISKIIITPDMNDMQKHCAIFAFIESRINRQKNDLDFSTAKMSGHNMDTGKLMELFFAANEIEYQMSKRGEKSKTQYMTKLNGEDVSLYPPVMYDPRREDGKYLLRSLHYKRNESGELAYICIKSPEITEEYKDAIISGRERAKNIDLESLKQESNFLL